MKAYKKLSGFLSSLTSTETWHHKDALAARAAQGEWFLRDELERQLIDKDTNRPY